MNRAHPAVLLLRLASLTALAFSVTLAIDYYGPRSTFCGPSGGCAEVRASDIGILLGDYLPALGLLVYTSLFVGSLFSSREALRAVGALAALGGVGAAAFLGLQALVIEAWCPFCVGVDVAALLAAAAGGWILGAKVGEPGARSTLASPWWGLFAVAVAGPLVWVFALPDPDLPAPIVERWDRTADVNIVEMADFECPYCRALDPVLHEAMEESGRDVHLARIMVPLPFHEHARGAAAAYLCAERQGEGDAMAGRLFESEDLTRPAQVAIAGELSLDVEAFEGCLDDEAIDDAIDADMEDARRAGMQGLPTVWVGERALVGFDARNGAAPYAEAIRDAAEGRGRRVRWWLFLALAILAGLIAGAGRRLAIRAAEKRAAEKRAAEKRAAEKKPGRKKP